MKTGLARVILFVSDIDIMCRFYVDVIGLQLKEGGDDEFRCLDAGGVDLCLHSLPGRYRSKDKKFPRRADAATKIVFRSDDVSSDRQTLVSGGIEMGKIFEYGPIQFCDGMDPEGNVFQISSRG